jgi:hypothetical protein
VTPLVASWLTGLTVLLLCMAGAGTYAVWRYVFQPWKVMRRDVVALNDRLNELTQRVELTLARRNVEAMTDEEIAIIENRQRRDSIRRASRGADVGGR